MIWCFNFIQIKLKEKEGSREKRMEMKTERISLTRTSTHYLLGSIEKACVKPSFILYL